MTNTAKLSVKPRQAHELDGEFDAMYSHIGRPSIPPEQLSWASRTVEGC